jgi:hypothetical protein
MTPLSFAIALYALGVGATGALLATELFSPQGEPRPPWTLFASAVLCGLLAAGWPGVLAFLLLDFVTDAVRRSK